MDDDTLRQTTGNDLILALRRWVAHRVRKAREAEVVRLRLRAAGMQARAAKLEQLIRKEGGAHG